MPRANPMARERKTMLRGTVVGKDKGAYLSAYRIHNAASLATRRANGRLFLAR